MERKIIHVDMDAFFAAVEQRDNPEYAGKPVIIGGDPTKRGVVSTASYEARKYGVRSAMPLREAYKRCPEGIFIPGNMEKYKEISWELQRIFYDFTPIVEPLSIDEAFLDVTGSQRLFGTPEEIGRRIKECIKEELRLTASIGIAGNKFLAKLGSDLEKPDGFVIIKSEDVEELLAPLPVSRIWGVGVKTEAYLNRIGIKTIGQLRAIPLEYLEKIFGSMGQELYNLARGIDNRPVQAFSEAKSIGREVTFEEDIGDIEKLYVSLLDLSQQVGRRLRKSEKAAYTVTVKVRYQGFETHTRSKTSQVQIDLGNQIYEVVRQLLDEMGLRGRRVRLVGVYVSNFISASAPRQISLLDNRDSRRRQLEDTMDKIKDKFGEDAISTANLLGRKYTRE